MALRVSELIHYNRASRIDALLHLTVEFCKSVVGGAGDAAAFAAHQVVDSRRRCVRNPPCDQGTRGASQHMRKWVETANHIKHGDGLPAHVRVLARALFVKLIARTTTPQPVIQNKKKWSGGSGPARGLGRAQVKSAAGLGYAHWSDNGANIGCTRRRCDKGTCRAR